MLELIRWLLPIAVAAGVSERLIRQVESRPDRSGYDAMLAEVRRLGTNPTRMIEPTFRGESRYVMVPDRYPRGPWDELRLANRQWIAWPVLQASCHDGVTEIGYAESFARGDDDEVVILSIDPRVNSESRIILGQALAERVVRDPLWQPVSTFCSMLRGAGDDASADEALADARVAAQRSAFLLDQKYGASTAFQRGLIDELGFEVDDGRGAPEPWRAFGAAGYLPVWNRILPGETEHAVVLVRAPSASEAGQIEIVSVEQSWNDGSVAEQLEDLREDDGWSVIEFAHEPGFASAYDVADNLSSPQLQQRLADAEPDNETLGIIVEQWLDANVGGPALAPVDYRRHTREDAEFLARTADGLLDVDGVGLPIVERFEREGIDPTMHAEAAYEFAQYQSSEGRFPDPETVNDAFAAAVAVRGLEALDAGADLEAAQDIERRIQDVIDSMWDHHSYFDDWIFNRLGNHFSVVATPEDPAPAAEIAARMFDLHTAWRYLANLEIPLWTDGARLFVFDRAEGYPRASVILDDLLELAPAVDGTVKLAFAPDGLELGEYVSWAERDNVDLEIAMEMLDETGTQVLGVRPPRVAAGGDPALVEGPWSDDWEYVIAYNATEALVWNEDEMPEVVALEEVTG